MRKRVLAAALLLSAAAAPAFAAVTEIYTVDNSTASGVDAAYEGPGGFLNGTLGFPLVGSTALPPLERAVAQVRQGVTDRRGLHLPTAGTDLPVSDGGSGVTTALTNVGAFAASTLDFGNGAVLPFSLSRSGGVINFTLGTASLDSNTRASFADIDSFQIRLRSQSTSTALGPNSIELRDVVLNDFITTDQDLGDFIASDGGVTIALFSGLTGDFSITGDFVSTWTAGQRPGGSALAAQVKLLDLNLETEVPAPASLALFGLGGLGLAARRRRG